MSGDKLRQQIVFEAARLMFQRQESEYSRARIHAARLVCRQRLRPSQLPTNREIREELQRLTGDYTSGDYTTSGYTAGDYAGSAAPPALPGADFVAAWAGPERFGHYRHLLVPLSRIQQNPRTHPEGDVLFHSLQVFRLACDELPYDEEFLLAGLLHDVGKGIDPHDPVPAGLSALGPSISQRTAWLIENLPLAQAHLNGTIGIRARRRLQNSESGEELIVLAKCDAAGRVPGAAVSELDEALAYLRELAEAND